MLQGDVSAALHVTASLCIQVACFKLLFLHCSFWQCMVSAEHALSHRTAPLSIGQWFSQTRAVPDKQLSPFYLSQSDARFATSSQVVSSRTHVHNFSSVVGISWTRDRGVRGEGKATALERPVEQGSMF